MKLEYPKEWFERSADIEAGQTIGADCPAAPCSPVVAWQKGILRVHDKDDLDCTDVHVLTIDGRTVLRAIVPVHGMGVPVSDADRKLIGQALAEYLANNEGHRTGVSPFDAPHGSVAELPTDETAR